MKAMRTLAPHKGTIITRQFAVSTTRLKGVATDSTSTVIGAPSPCRNTKPIVYLQEKVINSRVSLKTYLHF